MTFRCATKLAGVASGLLVAFPSNRVAVTPWVGTRPAATSAQCVVFDNLEELSARTDTVFAGTVIAKQPTGARGDHETVEVVTIRVEQSWKGAVPAEIRVGTDRPFELDKQYVVFAAGQPLSTTILCRWAEPVERATAKLDWLSKRRAEHEIYEALLKDIFPGEQQPSVLLIEGVPRVFENPPAWVWQKLGAGAERQASVERAVAPPATPFAGESFPPGTQLARLEEIEALLRPAVAVKDPEEGRRQALRNRFKVEAFQGFSRPIVTEDGLDALVSYSHHCGLLCGSIGYAWLHRTSRAGAWSVAKRVATVEF